MTKETPPQLRRFRGEIIVVKYGGSFMDAPDPAARDAVIGDLVALQSAGIQPVIVHGGGKAITRAMEAAGLKAHFVQGMRVTDEATACVVEQVLSREINPEITASFERLGGRACGFAGTDLFICRKLSLRSPAGEPLDVGFVGDVSSVRTAPLLQALGEGRTPVISPTARGADGAIYNCNADVAAAQTAVALKAGRLIFMSDVPGLLLDPKNPFSLIPRLAAGQVEGLKSAGVIDKGMIPKVDSAVAALRADVGRVSFIDGRVSHSILLEIAAGATTGTEIVL